MSHMNLPKAFPIQNIAPNLYLTLYDLSGCQEKDIEKWVESQKVVVDPEFVDQFGMLFFQVEDDPSNNKTPLLWRITSLVPDKSFIPKWPLPFTQIIVQLCEKALATMEHQECKIILFHPTHPKVPQHFVSIGMPESKAPSKEETRQTSNSVEGDLYEMKHGVVEFSSHKAPISEKDANGFFELSYMLPSGGPVMAINYFKLKSGSLDPTELMSKFEEYVKKTMMHEIITIGDIYLKSSSGRYIIHKAPKSTHDESVPANKDVYVCIDGLMRVEEWKDLYKKIATRIPLYGIDLVRFITNNAESGVFKMSLSEEEKRGLGIHPEEEHVIVIKVASGWIATYLANDEQYVVGEYRRDFTSSVVDEALQLIQTSL